MWEEFKWRLNKAKLNLVYCFCQKTFLFVFGKIQTFYTKYRPNKDPYYSKGL